jgi:hypothetical protein
MPILIRRVGQLMMLIWILGPKNIWRNPKPATTLNQTPLFSKYNSGFTYVAPAPKKNFKTYRRILKSIAGNKRYLKESL